MNLAMKNVRLAVVIVLQTNLSNVMAQQPMIKAFAQAIVCAAALISV
jgi:hypothetical protein